MRLKFICAFPHALATCLVHLIIFHSITQNNAWLRAEIMQLLVIQYTELRVTYVTLPSVPQTHTLYVSSLSAAVSSVDYCQAASHGF